VEISRNVTGKLLVVDDDANMQTFLQKFFTSDGHEVTTCSSAAEALAVLADKKDLSSEEQETTFDLLLTDVNMPEVTGHALLKSVKEIYPSLPIVLITAFGSIESAVEAMREGAHDYLTKPFKLDDVRKTITRALNFAKIKKENVILRREMKKSWTLGNMIGKSQKMQDVFEVIQRVSNVNANVLVLGESGTGKELVARAIHNGGPRAKKPFVAINCSAIPENLLESELFGHAKGSFTGAINQKRGLFEEGDGGTVFLDEIADMDLALQAKILRVIQEKKIRAVGQNNMRSLDVRIIAATHKNLAAAIESGRFREDLYYRLCVVPIALPALRDRKEDIPFFVEHFIQKYAEANGSSVKGVTDGAMAKLMSLPWEGNVRQLENTIERSIILCDSELIDEGHLSFLEKTVRPLDFTSPGTMASPAYDPNTVDSLKLVEMEKKCLESALVRAGGRKEKAAQLLGISRKTLYRKEREYGLAQKRTDNI
jgi:DNA-binding NtrC family response regulator